MATNRLLQPKFNLEPKKLEDKAFELIRTAIGKGIHDVAACLCAANCRHGGTFGKNVAKVWELNKTLDPGTSNEKIEAILDKIDELIYGAKLLGAGGGGFFFMATKGIRSFHQSQNDTEIISHRIAQKTTEKNQKNSS